MFLTLICVNWIIIENTEREREREREVGGDGICGCSFGEPLAHETFQYSLFIYIETSA